MVIATVDFYTRVSQWQILWSVMHRSLISNYYSPQPQSLAGAYPLLGTAASPTTTNRSDTLSRCLSPSLAIYTINYYIDAFEFQGAVATQVSDYRDYCQVHKRMQRMTQECHECEYVIYNTVCMTLYCMYDSSSRSNCTNLRFAQFPTPPLNRNSCRLHIL